MRYGSGGFRGNHLYMRQSVMLASFSIRNCQFPISNLNLVMANATLKSDFVVIGGGVAGICCAQSLAQMNPNASITLIVAKDLVKLVTNRKKITRALEEITVEEQPSLTLTKDHPNIQVINDIVCKINPEKSHVITRKGTVVSYKKLSICTGAKPHLIASSNEHVLGIRDVDSVAELQQKLTSSRRIIVIGNGGIALELIYELSGCEVIWAIKDDAIGNVFLDKPAAEFLLPALNEKFAESSHQCKADTVIFKRKKYAVEREQGFDKDKNASHVCGGALGPDWSMNTKLRGNKKNFDARKVYIEYNCEIQQIMDAEEFRKSNLQASELPDNFCSQLDWNAYVTFDNGKIYGTDLIISATGVRPNTELDIINDEMILSEDGGIKVDDNMRTNLPNIYAAGDVCSACWEHSPYWFQMRLWTQAYQMGLYAAKCMIENSNNENSTLDFCFEMFAHVTSFFGYKLCLLGKYNGQGLDSDFELLVRYTPKREYVKVILKDGRMVGALLLGETDLEETFENLILNGMDLSQFGDNLLNPDIEIEDFFD